MGLKIRGLNNNRFTLFAYIIVSKFLPNLSLVYFIYLHIPAKFHYVPITFYYVKLHIGESWGMANTFLSRPTNTKKIIFMS